MAGHRPYSRDANLNGGHVMGELPQDRSGWRKLLRRIARATRDPERAEDHLHAAFVKLTEYARKHKVENPTGFLVRTAVNASIDAGRLYDNRRDLHIPIFEIDDMIDDQPLQDEVIAVRDRLHRAQRVLAELSPRTKEIFLMHRADGMKYREIAEALGITMSAVEKHIAKAALHLLDHADD